MQNILYIENFYTYIYNSSPSIVFHISNSLFLFFHIHIYIYIYYNILSMYPLMVQLEESTHIKSFLLCTLPYTYQSDVHKIAIYWNFAIALYQYSLFLPNSCFLLYVDRRLDKLELLPGVLAAVYFSVIINFVRSIKCSRNSGIPI